MLGDGAMMSGDDPELSVDLLRRAQAGDEDARNDLLGRYLPRLERWASRRLPLSVRTMLDTGDIDGFVVAPRAELLASLVAVVGTTVAYVHFEAREAPRP